jgi:alpha-tubulin suppressor-like RCC1 family protein
MNLHYTLFGSLVLSVFVVGSVSAEEDTQQRIAAGGYHCMAVDGDGVLWTWGRNYAGQLGDGATEDSHVPIRIGKGDDWIAVSAGDHHSVAMKRDGSLWASGYNHFGQLGNGTTDNAHSPVLVKGGKDWVAFTAGDYHTIALKQDGSVWTWGCNKRGQLGIGSNEAGHKPINFAGDNWLVIPVEVETKVRVVENAHVPVRVGTDNDWQAVDAGGYYCVAIKKDGALWAWGDNRYGQMGQGTRNHELSPIRIGKDNDWASVYAGVHHVMAVKQDGTVWAWGLNEYQTIPVAVKQRDVREPVPALVTGDWLVMSGAWRHTLGLKRDGTLWAWGLNNYGQFGNGDTSDLGGRVLKGDAHVGVYGEQFQNGSKMPVQVAGGSDWVATCGQGHHSIGMKRDGSVWTWGLNWFGQLGIGSTENQAVPVRVLLGER